MWVFDPRKSLSIVVVVGVAQASNFSMPSTNPAYQKVVSRNNFESGAGGGSAGGVVVPRGFPENNRLLAGEEDDMEVPAHIPSTNSSEELMPHGGMGGSGIGDGGGGSDSEGLETGKVSNPAVMVRSSSGISRKELFTVFVLCFVNLINYMDRLTIAGEFRIQVITE